MSNNLIILKKDVDGNDKLDSVKENIFVNNKVMDDSIINMSNFGGKLN